QVDGGTLAGWTSTRPARPSQARLRSMSATLSRRVPARQVSADGASRNDDGDPPAPVTRSALVSSGRQLSDEPVAGDVRGRGICKSRRTRGPDDGTNGARPGPVHDAYGMTDHELSNVRGGTAKWQAPAGWWVRTRTGWRQIPGEHIVDPEGSLGRWG